MPDFWPSCGFRLLKRNAEGKLVVTDDYLRRYLARPELVPVPESCKREHALHAALIDEPRRVVTEEEIAAIADADARENYRVMLRFRDRLIAAPTLEAFYFHLFLGDVSVPPDFIHQTAQEILRNMLDGAENGLDARAAEIFFRTQRVTVKDGAVMLADAETVEMHATGGGFGDLGRLILEAQAPLRAVDLDVLDEASHAAYFERNERFDTVLNLNPGGAGSQALARVLERWIGHFHGVRVKVSPIREIPDEQWRWHVGLDVEATAMLNEIYNGGEIEASRMKRIIGLFRTEFLDPSAMRAELSGFPVFLGLAMTEDGTLRMKPQNLLMNLPLARRSMTLPAPYEARWQEIASGPDERVNLAEAALIFACGEYPELDVAAYLARIEEMATKLHARLRGDMAPAERILALNRYLFDELGFAANAAEYYDPRNSFLNEVLDRRLGIPITLSVVYLEIGRRIGLSLQGVAFPGHFLVKCVVRDGAIVLDPYGKGASLSLDDLCARLRALRNGIEPDSDQIRMMLAVASNKEIIARMLHNLKGIYLQRRELTKAVAAIDGVIALAPQAADEYRDRGRIHLEMECFRAALADFRFYLLLKPDAEDAMVVRQKAAELQHIAARLN